MHPNSELLFQKYAREYFRPGLRVLEIGPDKFPSTYQALVGDSSIQWDTIDLYQDPRLTYTAKSEYDFPIPDNTYDLVVSAQVIEHVRKIWVWMKELARVCKVGGVVITVNPVSWPYHEAPVDCWRMYPEGMRALYEDASLDVILSEWESLEAVRFGRTIPGRSPECQRLRLRVAYRVLNLLIGLPAECSFDTITIGKKVARPEGPSGSDGP
jgi:SAM-dependent methyltransferase